MRVLLLGANGMFGQRVATLLAAIPTVHIVLAGRDLVALQSLAARLPMSTDVVVEMASIDLDAADSDDVIRALKPDVLIDTCGPFQQRDYRLPRLAIAEGFHYIDLADAPDFVAGIGVLDEAAREANVLIVSGASSVPALSAAVLDEYREQFAELQHIDIGISPGNRAERGLATVRSILSGVGKPHVQFEHAAPVLRAGWSGLRRHRYPAPIGQRWLAFCPVPDPVILPDRYPHLQTFHFRAGVELRRMHFGIWLGGLLVRSGLLASLAPHAAWSRRVSEYWITLGSDCGGMHVQMRGLDRDGKALEIIWHLIAEDGDGPYVPAAAAVTLVRLLIEGHLPQRGARPCVGLLSLDAIQSTLSGRKIRYQCREN